MQDFFILWGEDSDGTSSLILLEEDMPSLLDQHGRHHLLDVLLHVFAGWNVLFERVHKFLAQVLHGCSVSLPLEHIGLLPFFGTCATEMAQVSFEGGKVGLEVIEDIIQKEGIAIGSLQYDGLKVLKVVPIKKDGWVEISICNLVGWRDPWKVDGWQVSDDQGVHGGQESHWWVNPM